MWDDRARLEARGKQAVRGPREDMREMYCSV